MRRRILLADDSVTIQKVIELTFLDEDYEVKAVSNGDEAIAALPQVDPDFVIADVHMPGANGYEVCRRSKELRPDIPVLLLVGTFEPFDEGQARSSGADSFLKKPFDSQELLQRVEELLAARPAAASAAPAASAAAAIPPAMPPAAPFAAAPDNDLLAMPSLSELPPLDLGPGPEPASAPAAGWGSFQVEPPPLPVSDLPAPSGFTLEDEQPFVLDEERPFTLDEEQPFAPAGESSFDESPFRLEDEEPLAASALPVDESAILPAGEQLFDLEPMEPMEPVEAAPAEAPAPSFEEPSFAAQSPFEAPVFEAPPPAWEAPPAFEAPPPFEPSFSPTETVRVDTRTFQVSGFATTPEESLGIPEGAVPLVESRAETEARIEAPAPPSIEASHEPPSTVSIPVPMPVVSTPASGLAVGAAAPSNGHLSDEDVDRIARRVVELMADRAIRDVAWEVIPDMAEMVIRDRLRELESQAESFE